MNGVIPFNKPSGISSNGALNRLKALLGVSKMGFLGTLDPLAQGVLPVFVGKATKLIADFESLDKAYRVSLRLGERTDTFDTEGTVLERRETGHLKPEEVREAVMAFQGTLRQTLPAYSAVKHRGVPAYRLARAGKPVPATVRPVRLWDLEVEAIALPELTFRVACSPGTYMRSLGEEIGQRLGVGAVVTRLERLRCGELFRIEHSHTLEAIREALERGERGFLLNPSDLLPDHHPYTVADLEEQELRQGRILPLEPRRAPALAAHGEPAARIKALRPGGTLVAIGEVVPTRGGGLGLQPTKVLV